MVVDDDNLNLSEISDAIDVSDTEQIKKGLQDQVAKIGPILYELFVAAEHERDLWLKKSSLRELTDWIISLQNVASLLEQQIEARGSVVSAQEQELEELRPTKKKIWRPGI